MDAMRTAWTQIFTYWNRVVVVFGRPIQIEMTREDGRYPWELNIEVGTRENSVASGGLRRVWFQPHEVLFQIGVSLPRIWCER